MIAPTPTSLREAPAEMATLVRMFREVRGWTQEMVAALSARLCSARKDLAQVEPASDFGGLAESLEAL